jgi:hypothetical protein
MKSFLVRLSLLAAVLALSGLSVPATAQVPDEFTNLKLLDKDIDKRELVGIMRDWAGGLGVRCNHCHVGPANLQGMDFASDEKRTKQATRLMLEMARSINREHMAEYPEDPDKKRQTVSCFTCHRGQAKPPRNLALQLSETALASGPDVALDEFKSLREEYEGAGVYNFRAETLMSLAQAAFEAGKLDAAVQVLDGGLEIFPESADMHSFMGMAKMQGGDASGATQSFEKALELDPENSGAKRGMMMLERQKEGGG